MYGLNILYPAALPEGRIPTLCGIYLPFPSRFSPAIIGVITTVKQHAAFFPTRKIIRKEKKRKEKKKNKT